MSRLAIQSVFSTLFIIAVSLPAWGQGGGCESEREEIRARYYSLSNQCMKLINDKDKKIDDKNKELSLSKMAIPRIDLSSSDTSGDYGSPIRMSAKIYNSSDHIIKIDASRTCLHVPSKLLVGNGDPAKKCIPPDNLESRIEIQPNSEFTLTWETTQSKYISGNIIEVLIGGFTFKPELYVFTVNIDMHHEVNGSTAKVNVVREVRVQVELPRYAVWIYSLIGILLMNIGWVGFQWVKYAPKFGTKFFTADIPERRHMISIFFGNLLLGFSVGTVLVLLTLASHKAGRIISINILDFYGAVVAGIVAQYLIITRRHEKHLDN